MSARAVTSVSTTSRDNSTGALSVSAAGTQFLGLSVAGVPIGGTPAPNTKITLPGVGYVLLNQQTPSIGAVAANLTVTLWLHRVVQTGSSIRVIMIQLNVTVPSNPLGLSPGTVVDIASAQVNVN